MQTLRALNTYLPNSLAALASDYLWPRGADAASAATHGHHELFVARMPSAVDSRLLAAVVNCDHEAIITHAVRTARIIDSEMVLRVMCRRDMYDVAVLVLDVRKPSMDNSLLEACDAGHIRMAQLLLERGATNADGGLFVACAAGNKQMATLMVGHGASNFREAAIRACMGHNIVLVRALLNRRGPDIINLSPTYVTIYGQLFKCYTSVDGQHTQSYCLGMEGPFSDVFPPGIPWVDDWEWGLDQACLYGNMRTIQHVIDNGASDWNRGLISACAGGHPEVVALMLKKGAYNLRSALEAAVMCNHVKVAALLIKHGADAGRHTYTARVWGNRAMRRLFGQAPGRCVMS